MISCTLESFPTLSSQKVPSQRCESLRSSSSGAPNYATQIQKKTYARLRTGTLLRSSCSASQARFRSVQGALLQAGDRRLKDGVSACSRSARGSNWFELDSRQFNFCGRSSKKSKERDVKRPRIITSNKLDGESDDDYCDRSADQPHGACSFRKSSSPSNRVGTHFKEVPQGTDPDQSGYTIKVSRELMGVFRYVEKVKRARIKDLADTLKQTAAACMFFSCVRGILGPLVEVFQTEPPSWGRLILMLSAVDSFAITYLALKAAEPLEKLSMLASESDKDIMGSIEKEEEHMLALAVELVKLFRRLRNITVITAVAQFASLAHTFLQLNNPKLVAHATRIIGAWFHIPWN